MHDLFYYRTKIEIETHRRIRISVWAYAYEYEDDSIVSDHEFDEECQKVDLSIATRRPDLDDWFRKEFVPDTGMWIGAHPELEQIKKLYETHYKKGEY